MPRSFSVGGNEGAEPAKPAASNVKKDNSKPNPDAGKAVKIGIIVAAVIAVLASVIYSTGLGRRSGTAGTATKYTREKNKREDPDLADAATAAGAAGPQTARQAHQAQKDGDN